MRNFFSIDDVDNISKLLETCFDFKKQPWSARNLGKDKILSLVFLNPSLRTRLSSQKAAMHLGLECMVTNLEQEGWKLETRPNVCMDQDRSEHIIEAARVLAQYSDIIGLRSFPSLRDREYDYKEVILNAFSEYSQKPVISLESATRHPLQALADVMTIEEQKKTARPKVVLCWAPHVKALPQSVANSFAETTLAMDYDLTIAHPEGYHLDERFTSGACICHEQMKALEGADFVYVKNWSSFENYGKILCEDTSWTMTQEKLAYTNHAKFMHCLPIRRNLVASDDILDSDRSLVIEQANNRVFAIQAVLKSILES